MPFDRSGLRAPLLGLLGALCVIPSIASADPASPAASVVRVQQQRSADADIPSLMAYPGTGVSQAASSVSPEQGPVTPARYPSPGLLERYRAREVSYTHAVELAEHGEIDSLLVTRLASPVIYIRVKDGELLTSGSFGVDRLMKDFGSRGFEIIVEDGSFLARMSGFVMLAANVLMVLVMVGVLFMFANKFGKNPARRMRKGAGTEKVTFKDVAGQTEAKENLKEVIDFLSNPDKFKKLGARAPRGVLLVGPPGNGKTLLARGAAGEAKVPFFSVAGSEILEMWAGLGARRVRQIFSEGRRHKACVIFIDEVDTIGGKRGAAGTTDVQGERDQILNQLLVELDGMDRKGNIVLICATNRPDTLDEALTRPGRLDRRIDVPKPELFGRKEIIEIYLAKISRAEDLDVDELARMTPGFSGADLANLVNEAAILAGRRGMDAVDMQCFHDARDTHLLGAPRSGDIMSPEEIHSVSIHEAGHALVALRQECLDPIQKATILPRGRSLGCVVTLGEREYVLNNRDKLKAMLALAMGGTAAEEFVFGEGQVTNGASADIRHATSVAREMVGRFGMDKVLGHVDYLGDDYGRGAASAATMAKVDDAIRKMVDEAFERASAIIHSEPKALEAIAAALRERKTLSGADVKLIADKATRVVDNEQAAEGALDLAAD